MSGPLTVPETPRYATDGEDEEFARALDEAPPEALRGFLSDLLALSPRRKCTRGTRAE